MIKRITALFAALIILLSLCACTEDKYPPVESTEEEAKTVLTLEVDGKKYDVKYELYRALFLNNKALVDQGDSSVWESDNKQEYIDKINEIIITDLSEIFAVMYLADEIGFDAYSADVDARIKEYIVGAVEGDENQLGHGSYEEYLESLKKNNLNYSAAVFMLRYAIAEEAVFTYYLGEYDSVQGQLDGEFEYTREDVENYYYSSECARILQAYFQTGVKTPSQIADYRNQLLSKSNEYEIASYIIGSTMATESDLIKDGTVSGITLGKNELYASEYDVYNDCVFSLEEGELSEVITLENSNADGYYVVYRLEKDAEHFESSYSQIRNSYLDSIAGEVLKSISKALSDSASFAEGYASINHKDISMP